MNASGRVVRVVDGDTIEIAFRVRLRGSNAPELRTIAGRQAKRALEESYWRGKAVAAEIFANDAYGRLVATIDPT